MLVSITAQADQGPDMIGGVTALSSVRSASAPFAAFRAAESSGFAAPLIQARFAVGAPNELSAVPDEIDPRPAFKANRAASPLINRARKGDPIVSLRPGLDARARSANAAVVASRSADWPVDSRSPAHPASAPLKPETAFGDGATPSVPMAIALSSSSPMPSDGKLRIGAAKPGAAPQTTVAAKVDPSVQPDYASLIEPKDSARQMRCLAEAIYFESRSEPEAGQAAVAQVVLNRVRSGIFPTNICGVVYQDRNRPFACQFSFACEGKSLRIEEPGAFEIATRIAEEVVEGVNFNPRVAEALNYHAAYVTPFWAPSLRRVDRIGLHIFYSMRQGLNWAPGALNGRGDLPPVTASAK